MRQARQPDRRIQRNPLDRIVGLSTQVGNRGWHSMVRTAHCHGPVMNYWPKHIGPWLKATVTLSAVEEGLYSRLCDWCYAQERPLPLDEPEILLISRARDRTERDTTMTVVRRFFVQTDTGFRHERIERELINARKRGAASLEFRSTHAERQKRYRDRRRSLYLQAYELGVPPAAGIHATNEQLVEAIVKAGASPRYVERDVTRDVTRDASLTTATVTAPEAGNRESHTLEEGRYGYVETSRVTVTRDVTAAGAACKRMRSMGMASVNPSDPRLLELLDAGVEVEDIAMAAAQAQARGKGFAYALAIAKGQHEEKQQQLAKLAEWAPNLVSKG